jgi:hypothetical protein
MLRAESALDEVWRSVGLTLAAGVTVALLTACSGGGEEAPTTADPSPLTTTETTPESTTTEPTTTEPLPLTSEERAWARQANNYADRLEKDWNREVTITHAVMRHWASLFAKCKTTLREAGDPGRYAPAARVVRRACAKLAKARAQIAIAMGASDSGGAVIAGTAEEDQFNRALDRFFELAGNALNDLNTAREKAAAITAEYGT